MKLEIFLVATASCTDTWPKPRPGEVTRKSELQNGNSRWPKPPVTSDYIANYLPVEMENSLVEENHMKVSGMWPKAKPSHSKLTQQTTSLRAVKPVIRYRPSVDSKGSQYQKITLEPVSSKIPSALDEFGLSTKKWPKPKFDDTIPVEFDPVSKVKSDRNMAEVESSAQAPSLLEDDLETSRVIILQPLPDIEEVEQKMEPKEEPSLIRIQFEGSAVQSVESTTPDQTTNQERGPRPDDPVSSKISTMKTTTEKVSTQTTTTQVHKTGKEWSFRHLPRHEIFNVTTTRES